MVGAFGAAIALTGCPQPSGSPPTSATDGETTSSTGDPATTLVDDESTTTRSTTTDDTAATDDTTSTTTSSSDVTTTSGPTTGDDTTSTTTDDDTTSTTTGADACGDGIVDPGEECDYGAANDDSAACTKGCKKAVCGDNLTHLGIEECDNGEANQDGVYGGCTLDCKLGPYCGDGHTDLPYEQCDPADPELEDVAVCGPCIWAGKLIFASSTTYSGNLGGLSGADTKCQSLAEAADIIGEGRAFRAWLSSEAKDAVSRLSHSDDPYILPSGSIVADNWADLTDGTLKHAIDRNEKNMPIEDLLWSWTATTPQGFLADGATSCEGWTSGVSGKGIRGKTESATSTWTLAPNAAASCVTQQRIYCVEQ